MARIIGLDEFLEKAQARSERTVSVPEFGEDAEVVVQNLTMHERRLLDKRMNAQGKTDGVKGTVLTVVYGMLEPKLSEEHVIALEASNGAVIDRIAAAILELSGLKESDVEAAEGN